MLRPAGRSSYFAFDTIAPLDYTWLVFQGTGFPIPMVNGETTSQEIELSIRRFIAKSLLNSKDELRYPDDASLLREGVIDSLGVVELVEFLEMQFTIKVEQQDVRPDNFDSVARMAAYVRRKTSAT